VTKAGWFATFWVCIRRYVRKALRKRKNAYALLLVTGLLGALCGSLHSDEPDNNDLLIFLLLFNAIFGSLVATSTITSLGGGSSEDCALFMHEAASGVMQTAEVTARVLIDMVWPLALFAPVFALPIKGLCSIPIPVMELLVDWWFMTFAFSPFGYIFTLIAPGNAVVLTSSAALVSCAFGTGFFGLKLLSLTPGLRTAFRWITPGCPAFYLLSFGSAIYNPVSLPRAFLLYQLRLAGLVMPPNPAGPLDDVRIEQSGEAWQHESLMQMFTFGLILRALTIVLFTWKSNDTWARLASPERKEWLRDQLTCVCLLSPERRELLDVRNARRAAEMVTLVAKPPALHEVENSAIAAMMPVKAIAAATADKLASTRRLLIAQSTIQLQLPSNRFRVATVSEPSKTDLGATSVVTQSHVNLELPALPELAGESTTQSASSVSLGSNGSAEAMNTAAPEAAQSAENHFVQSRVERARTANSQKVPSSLLHDGTSAPEPEDRRGSFMKTLEI